jgi:hypothetical protein
MDLRARAGAGNVCFRLFPTFSSVLGHHHHNYRVPFHRAMTHWRKHKLDSFKLSFWNIQKKTLSLRLRFCKCHSNQLAIHSPERHSESTLAMNTNPRFETTCIDTAITTLPFRKLSITTRIQNEANWPPKCTPCIEMVGCFQSTKGSKENTNSKAKLSIGFHSYPSDP